MDDTITICRAEDFEKHASSAMPATRDLLSAIAVGLGRRVTDAERMEAIDLVRRIYESPNGGAGCCLHCILDDGNDEDGFVKSSYYDEPGAVRHDDCRRLLELLRKMKRTQRRKIIAQGHRLCR